MPTDYQKQIGPIADLMPPHMTERYQHIAVEYLLLLDTYNDDKPTQVIASGIEHNLNQLFQQSSQALISEEQYDLYMDSLLAGLQLTKQALADSLNTIKKELKAQYNTKTMDVFLRTLQASRKIRAAIDLPADTAKDEFAKAAALFESCLAVNDKDYMSYFQLGWLKLWGLGDPEGAQAAFSQAAELSHTNDEYMHVFALRHLAFVLFSEQRYDAATNIIQQVREYTNHEHVLVEYEALYYALYAEQPEYVEQHFEALANDHPLYFLMLQAEPRFQAYASLKSLPETIRLNKLKNIRRQIDELWTQSPMKAIRMEEGCNVDRVYTQTSEHYMNELATMPFNVLEARRESVSAKILQVCKDKIAIEIDKRHKLYSKQIQEKGKPYRWFKSLGKFIFVTSLYLIAATLIIGIYLLLDRFVLPGDAGIYLVDWSILLSSLLIIMSLSFLMTTFETGKVKKLYAKQKLVADALNKLHNSSLNN